MKANRKWNYDAMQSVKREEAGMMGEAEIPASSSSLQHLIILSCFSIERHTEGLQVTVQKHLRV